MDELKYITGVEIKGLWNKYDFNWELKPDVNILSGINGSGKSTILKVLSGVWNGVFPQTNQQKDIIFEIRIKAEQNCLVYHRTNQRGTPLFYEISQGSNTIYSTETQSLNGFATQPDLSTYLQTDIINTFDNNLLAAEAIQKLSNNEVVTELDWNIYSLENKYKNYQLDIYRKIKNNASSTSSEIWNSQNKFFSIIDYFFESTGKKINTEANGISFTLNGSVLTPYQLSSGEKQLLIILLTVLVQDNKNTILFMDEPELSLHFDWQKKLIGYIRELNPNVQIIIATHSPALVMEGWLDKVSEMSDLLTPMV